MKTCTIEVEFMLEAEDLEDAEEILREIFDAEPVISEYKFGSMSAGVV